MAKIPEQEEKTSFTVDSTQSGAHTMPSINRLLNRKSLKEITQTKTLIPPPPPSATRTGPIPSRDSSYRLAEPSQITITTKNRTSEGTLALDSLSQPHEPSPAPELSIANPLLDSTLLVSPAEGLAQTKSGRSSHELTVAPQDGALPLSVDTPSTATGLLKIQPSTRKAPTSVPKLNLWELKALEKIHDPLGQGIQVMLQHGATHVLFLAITPPPPGSPVPHFTGTATVNPQHKLSVWTGLKWDPTLVPEMWNYFIRSGQVELSPPGTLTNHKSNRNVVRAAFGILQNEWFLLVRAGPAHSCRGVVAFVSAKSILSNLPAALSFLQAVYPTNRDSI